ncbi:hypothetical protein VU13_01455 [Desulfobulbus sp. US5]|nr:hypothetical protein [Desulfobulbus sp. US5]
MLEQIDNLQEYRISATGRKFRNMLNFSGIAEPEAVELSTGFILPPDHPYRVIISVGGETTMVYHLDDDGRVNEIHTGNKCASGTGEFFLQQLGRMSITLDESGQMDLPEKPHKVSGRCSVFCKSDCTHALNKGVPKDQVVAGLSRMMSGKVMELLKKLPKDAVMLVGGCVGNRAMVHYLQEAIPNLYIPEELPPLRPWVRLSGQWITKPNPLPRWMQFLPISGRDWSPTLPSLNASIWLIINTRSEVLPKKATGLSWVWMWGRPPPKVS